MWQRREVQELPRQVGLTGQRLPAASTCVQVRQAEQALTPDDLVRAEAALGIALPPAMRAQYLQHNGGMPVWPRWPEKTGGSPVILLNKFIEFWWCKGFCDDPLQTLPARTPLEWAGTDPVLGQVPADLLPFAVANTCDYLCLRHTDGAIALWDRSTQKLTWVCASFEALMAGLQPDDSPMPGSPVLDEHAFWDQVFDFCGEAQPSLQFSHPCLGGGAVPIHLGEFKAQRRPSQRLLDGYADTYRAFVADIDHALAQIESQGFAHAQRLYATHSASHSEDLPRACPDCLSSAPAHMAAMQNPLSLSALDPEHGIEFKFVAGRLREVAGIATT